MLVSYPLDRRLWAHLRSDPNANWPTEARREQNENANLIERGVAERKTYAVSTHGLDLWSELTQVEPEAEEILRRAEDRVHEIPHQFGRPTVHVPNYEERLKSKKKEVPPSRQSESEQTPSGSKRTAGPRKFGGRPTYDAKRGKGTGVHRTALHREFGSQLSVRSDRSGESSFSGASRSQGTPVGSWNACSIVEHSYECSRSSGFSPASCVELASSDYADCCGRSIGSCTASAAPARPCYLSCGAGSDRSQVGTRLCYADRCRVHGYIGC
ncbi:hypothetical protein AAVH_04803 [Aphelenchoides avenae]|nr:hypothetical protein AAVH_04803 [Aphelenchus avenae]